MVDNYGALADLIGKPVGFLSLTKPQTHRRTYEMAAWWTDLESEVGTFDLVLQREQFYPHRLKVVDKVPATVTAAYTQAHFVGMPIGNQPQQEKHRDVGRSDAFALERDLVEAVCEGGGSHDHEIRYVVAPELHTDVAVYAEAILEDALTYVAAVMEAYSAPGRTAVNAGLSSVRYAHDSVAKAAEHLDRLKFVEEFDRDYSYASNYSRVAADAWIKENVK